LPLRSIFVFFILLISLLNISCSDSPSSIGKDLLSQDLINLLEIDSSTDSLFQSSSTHKSVIPLSGASRLLLGKKDNITAEILIKFLIYFDDSLKQQLLNNELSVLSAKVTLTKNYTFGDSNATIDYSVHEINSSWSTDFTADSLALLGFDANDIAFDKSFSDSLNSFYFNPQIALNWLKATADSNLTIDQGIYIQPSTNSEKVIGFYALSYYEEVPVPLLELVIEKSGVYVDTVSYFPLRDLSVVSGSVADVGTEDMAIQSGLNSEARLYFDLSKVPSQIIVNYAQLILTVDTLKTITGSNFTNALRLFIITDSSNLAVDSTYAILLDRDGDTFKGNISAFIQKYIYEKNNQGYIISASDKVNGVELFAIKGSNASNFEERPRLKIIYTSKK
jgi:hypothetical protein